ncbi:hypothetical protein HanHA300_Chr17g0636751 [Helianthus annuus]|nr:hypothetical protein HanHA300_Chr17g0636751 [Helianthus annuus]KAJ0445862.1 hypothetical protein HanHA89_Chr17g0688051 [Helianthus annuus]KAJ0630828.1 hypothetical protein HanLR1_Chr17g0647451 [Helianthus annuus]
MFLTKNGDCFTFETSQVDVCLISPMVTTLGSWKDRFFWISESIVPFRLVWRHPDAMLNKLKPFESELDCLKAIRKCPSRLRPFPERLLVLMGVSTLWDSPDRDPVLMRYDQGMMFCLMLYDDTSDVVFGDAEARGAEHRFEGSGYVNLPNVKGFTRVGASKASTHCLTRRMLKRVDQLSASEPVQLSDDIEASDDLEVGVERT